VFETLLGLLARELDRAGIPYMIIGGQAVQLYGEPRLTRDIDLTLGLGVEGLPRVVEVCGRCGLKPLPAAPDEFVRETMVLPALDERTGIRVDFVFSFTEYERQAIGRSRPVALDGASVRFAAVEDIVIHKLVAGRHVVDYRVGPGVNRRDVVGKGIGGVHPAQARRVAEGVGRLARRQQRQHRVGPAVNDGNRVVVVVRGEELVVVRAVA